MAGRIEHQQGISHSALIEKLHRVTQEHQAVYQQYAGTALAQKNIQNRHVVIKSQSSPDSRVNERNQKKHRQSQPRTHHNTTQEPEADAGPSGEIINTKTERYMARTHKGRRFALILGSRPCLPARHAVRFTIRVKQPHRMNPRQAPALVWGD